MARYFSLKFNISTVVLGHPVVKLLLVVGTVVHVGSDGHRELREGR